MENMAGLLFYGKRPGLPDDVCLKGPGLPDAVCLKGPRVKSGALSRLISLWNGLISLCKVQNIAALLVIRVSCHQNCTPLLQQLHWLPISERIKYKTACMCYNAITGSAPSYLSELLHLYTPSRSSSDTSMLKLQWLAPTSGTVSPKTSGTLLLSLPSKANSRFLFSEYFS